MSQGSEASFCERQGRFPKVSSSAYGLEPDGHYSRPLHLSPTFTILPLHWDAAWMEAGGEWQLPAGGPASFIIAASPPTGFRPQDSIPAPS